MHLYLTQAIDILQPILLLALTWASLVVANWIRAKVKSEYFQGVLLRLDDAVLTAVKELQQTTVQDVKEAIEGGKLDADGAKNLRAKAIARVKTYLGSKGIAELEAIVDVAAIEAMLEAKIEAAVLDIKRGVE